MLPVLCGGVPSGVVFLHHSQLGGSWEGSQIVRKEGFHPAESRAKPAPPSSLEWPDRFKAWLHRQPSCLGDWSSSPCSGGVLITCNLGPFAKLSPHGIFLKMLTFSLKWSTRETQWLERCPIVKPGCRYGKFVLPSCSLTMLGKGAG